MAESKHTPGPWLVVKCDGGFRAFDTDDWTIIGQNKIVPALVWGGVAFEEGKANARLIAAAPEMLEALQAARSILDEQISPNACAMADAAIAKAIGG